MTLEDGFYLVQVWRWEFIACVQEMNDFSENPGLPLSGAADQYAVGAGVLHDFGGLAGAVDIAVREYR